ncbi:hypothetical protein [Helicobacter sp. MIT 14-3879]|uniref:hypothetical protein n=1 Tax=Helicobacter sp. MIT 14-3879 TaxID=2040649 RepID=UPI000E1E3964|nr:hypothetical protein [Helicobacter sp. MIT 14-3879]RDU64150.1 hypothetical protein CQA44_04290 [Helicobacter sp. MIT 14-3879]
MSILNRITTINGENKKAIMILVIIILMVGILALITYLFFYNPSQTTYDDVDIPAINEIQVPNTQTEVLEQSNNRQDQVNTQDQIAQTNVIQEQNIPSITEANNPVIEDTVQDISQVPQQTSVNTISSLKYTIKPNNADIFFCTNLRNGKWKMPQQCENDISVAVQKLISDNTELIALEVSGIVDSNPYSGPSAELKQEGLASFRAREAISVITRGHSNIAVFEGPSIQENNKRGFQIKAYYLQK